MAKEIKKINRYPGPAAFETEQKEVFFGREKDSQALFNLVIREKITALYAKSGLGKSSLINAGLIPLLEQQSQIQPIFVRFTVHQEGKENPTPTEILLRNIPKSEEVAALAQLVPNKNSIWYALKNLTLKDTEKRSYLFIFDQFEELFTYPPEQINQFKRELADALYKEMPDAIWENYENLLENNELDLPEETLIQLESKIPVKLLFSIREDKYSQLNQITDALPDTGEHRYALTALNSKQAQEAIIQPAQKEGDFSSTPFAYSSEALAKILSFLSVKHTQPIETTQLQILCSRIEDLKLTEVKSSDIPEFDDIFLDFYESIIQKVPKTEELATRRLVENELIRQERRISVDKLACEEKVSQQGLQVLLQEHLLRAEVNSVEGISYEVAHDTLISPILQAKKIRETKEEEEKRKKETRASVRKFIIAIGIISFIAILLFLYILQLTNFNDELKEQQTQLENQKIALQDTTNQLQDARVRIQNIIDTLDLSEEDREKLNEVLNKTNNLVGNNSNQLDSLNTLVMTLRGEIETKGDIIAQLRRELTPLGGRLIAEVHDRDGNPTSRHADAKYFSIEFTLSEPLSRNEAFIIKITDPNNSIITNKHIDKNAGTKVIRSEVLKNGYNFTEGIYKAEIYHGMTQLTVESYLLR